jgi:hypothetical protein
MSDAATPPALATPRVHNLRVFTRGPTFICLNTQYERSLE